MTITSKPASEAYREGHERIFGAGAREARIAELQREISRVEDQLRAGAYIGTMLADYQRELGELTGVYDLPMGRG